MSGLLLVTGVSSLLSFSTGIKVLTTSSDLENRKSFAEISNSSVRDYEEMTVCGRFLTLNFPPVSYPAMYHVLSVDNKPILGEAREEVQKNILVSRKNFNLKEN